MKKTLQLLALGATVLGIVPAAGAQKASEKAPARHESQATLKAEAKVTEADARKTALAKLPTGRIKASELERENGKLIYSFEIVTKGKSGIDEVNVDAITGAVVGDVEHESPATEKKEAKMEKAEAKAEAREKKKP